MCVGVWVCRQFCFEFRKTKKGRQVQVFRIIRNPLLEVDFQQLRILHAQLLQTVHLARRKLSRCSRLLLLRSGCRLHSKVDEFPRTGLEVSAALVDASSDVETRIKGTQSA